MSTLASITAAKHFLPRSPPSQLPSRLFQTRIALSCVHSPRLYPARSSALTISLFHTSRVKMTVHEFKSKADFDAAIKENKLVIVDCSATWCGPCKMISPVFDQLSNDESNSTIYFAKFDVDEVPDLAQELGVTAMPTFKVIKDGEVADEMVGANPPALKAIVTKHLSEQ